MSPLKTRPAAPAWGRAPAGVRGRRPMPAALLLGMAFVCVLVVPAAAQPKKGGKTPPPANEAERLIGSVPAGLLSASEAVTVTKGVLVEPTATN